MSNKNCLQQVSLLASYERTLSLECLWGGWPGREGGGEGWYCELNLGKDITRTFVIILPDY